jgi:pimeloyl-ACP methyl ester carboxylesterase
MGGLWGRLRLARWLGPWMDQSRSPPARRERVSVGETYAHVCLPQGRRPRGSLLLVPGFHYDGPDDARMQRLAAVLANAGLLVYAPSLRGFRALRLRPDLMTDASAAFEALLADPRRPRRKPGILSISFGSLPALMTAAQFPAQVGGVLTFGGFADWAETIRFNLEGAPGRAHDPLNRPAVFLNLIDQMPPPANRVALEAAWRGFIVATWGRPEMRALDRRQAVAGENLEAVDPADRALFLAGCGLTEGGTAQALAAIAREDWGWIDPRPHLGAIRGPLFFVHGADDDVVPVEQAALLLDSCRPDQGARALITGVYGHSNPAHEGPPRRGRLAEARTMWSILDGVMRITEQRSP